MRGEGVRVRQPQRIEHHQQKQTAHVERSVRRGVVQRMAQDEMRQLVPQHKGELFLRSAQGVVQAGRHKHRARGGGGNKGVWNGGVEHDQKPSVAKSIQYVRRPFGFLGLVSKFKAAQ